jgi:uncharacterized protein (TIGR00369 family)
VYEVIRAGMVEAVPFARLLGVELLEVGDGFARARLLQRPDLSNHIGSLHAGALFTAAETTSGAAVAGAFLEMIGTIRPVAAEARIAYMKLARGRIGCTARTVEPAEELRRRLREEEKIVFDVVVDLVRDDEQPVASMIVSWHVRLAVAAAQSKPASDEPG